MAFTLKVDAKNPPTDALMVVEIINSRVKDQVNVIWCDDWNNTENVQLLDKNGVLLTTSSNGVARYFGRTIAKDIYGCTAETRTEVDHWLSIALGPLRDVSLKYNMLSHLDKVLMANTWLVAKRLTAADIYIFCVLVDKEYLRNCSNEHPNLKRWYTHIFSLETTIDTLLYITKNQKVVQNEAPKETASKVINVKKQEGKFIDLPGAEMGKVVVRFPPEASGYLHIGHAKAALLNKYYADAFNGKLILRFDDTNPAKENVQFEQAILEDLELLNIKPDSFTCSSDYFDVMLKYCTMLIENGTAFVDDTPSALMKEQRDQKIMSANRNNSVEKNMELWNEMQKGTEKGQECCVRAKIDFQSVNGCLRDPTIYRCKPEPHPRTGTKFKVYPTYDFACPIVDAIEMVTHTLRTTEYHDRDAQYYWMIDALKLRRPYIWEYSRLNMTNTVLSKRKLTWFVENGIVDGWDDPRFPTVRGILRRGMTAEGLKQFITAQGSSKSVVFMTWDKLWAFNKKVINPVAIRYTALDCNKTVPVNVTDAKEEWLTVQNHPKDPSKGVKRVQVKQTILIEREDAEALIEGQNTTFINWGNLLITRVQRDEDGYILQVDAKLNVEDKNYKNTLKVTWLSETLNSDINCNSKDTLIPCYAVYFDHIISKPVLGKDDDFKDFVNKNTRTEIKMLGEPELRRVQKGEIIELQRKGFFRCDVPYSSISSLTSREQPLILFHIPDGHTTTSTAHSVKNTLTQAAPKQINTQQKDEKIICINAKQVEDKIVNKIKNILIMKAIIRDDIKEFKSLRTEYKQMTGKECKLVISHDVIKESEEAIHSYCQIEEDAVRIILESGKAKNLSLLIEEIQDQEDRIRKLRKSKGSKHDIDEEVRILLKLEAEFKKMSGQDWESIVVDSQSITDTTTTENKGIQSINKISDEIQKQGDKIRQLKTLKAEKHLIDKEVKILLSLKGDYKAQTGQDWKPATVVDSQNPTNTAITENKEIENINKINEDIQKQGDKIRQLKTSKAEKHLIDKEVKILLGLKGDYKALTGQDWKPIVVGSQSITNIPTTENKEIQSINKISDEIQKQGDKVRQLKTSKAEKHLIDKEVKILLGLKGDYKALTGQDWKPIVVGSQSITDTPTTENKEIQSINKISDEIQKQGDKIRQLKTSKAEKHLIDKEVKILLGLKGDYKALTGQDWKPIVVGSQSITDTPTTENKEIQSINKISDEIQKQGDKIRQLKTSKAEKHLIDKEVKILLGLKGDYKALTGQDWKPIVVGSQSITDTPTTENKEIQSINKISDEIQKQGDKIRQLKTSKAEKHLIDKEVKILLGLKSDYKALTGQDWKPATVDSQNPRDTAITENKEIENINKISEEIQKQGDNVRQLKNSKAEKHLIDQEVKILLSLKNDYKIITGKDWVPLKPNASPKKQKTENSVQLSKKTDKDPAHKTANKIEADVSKTGTRLGLEADKEDNFSDWYSQVITKSGMIEYYDVSGCYILRPWSYAVWKIIKEYIDQEITKLGVEECYFPIFVTQAVLEREKSHIADFAPEVAWVTKCGNSDLAEPVAIRPTSETVMYPAYSKWLRSDTELPLRLNQWNNVVRWEFKDPKPFLRTREFLWQEGHSAFATKAEADEEVLTILDIYAKVYENLLAVPVIKGRKTEKEKFAGGDYTTTVEAFISVSGRGIQGATSHHLGQNFSKMFNIQLERITENEEKTFVYQNSWGLTTRTIGVMIMVHGDNKGLVLPPNVAAIQAVIVPCGVTAKTTSEQKEILMAECNKLLDDLSQDRNLKVKADFRNNRTPGWKFNHWELKGVPVRIELGPKDLEKNQVTFVRRDNNDRLTSDRANVLPFLHKLLNDIQTSMFERAKKNLDEHIKQVENWNEFQSELNNKNLLLVPFCGEPSCEDNIKTDSARNSISEETEVSSMGAKSLCIPFEQPKPSENTIKCIYPNCQRNSEFYTLFGRSY